MYEGSVTLKTVNLPTFLIPGMVSGWIPIIWPLKLPLTAIPKGKNKRLPWGQAAEGN